jgi:hypothetical protein
MSQYSLEILNKHKYIKEFEETIEYNFQNMFMFNHFRVSKEPDMQEVKNSLLYLSILEKDVCELEQFINKKLAGELEGMNCKTKTTDRFAQLIHEFNRISKKEESIILNATMNWENVMW